ncbi:glycoside hydrolase family 3 N-terminal domain-containing protein [Microbacterium sp. NPDC019599]|uniref:glycoside hydrolase family 3 protein n=1 Tax=Microbacterium sp. NPDC019599 TaxID=3154690 RepID=UPI0033CAF307
MTTVTDTRFPFQDPTLSPEQRADDLLSRLPLEDKAGLLFVGISVYGDPSQPSPMFPAPSLESTVSKLRINHIYVIGDADSAREFAQWHNTSQDIAARTGFGIPITFGTDPRHGFHFNPGASAAAKVFSQWPEHLGFGALRSEELVEQYGDIIRREYTAVGLRLALHPQIDLATEPRWARLNATFGEDPDLVAGLGAAYVRGLQGTKLGLESVSAMAKHFPGGGPQKDGEDPHFAYGKEQIYPGGRWDDHLKPFIAAIEAGVSQMMPYYGMPVGTQYDEVGFAFNKAIITDLLRTELGFDGIVCTDFGLVSDVEMFGAPFPARAWGVEDLSAQERIARIFDAGCDQLGGEFCVSELLGAVCNGLITEERLDQSARRVLIEKFTLGLFDDRHVDPEQAELAVATDEMVQAGIDAQRHAHTLLTNGTADAPTLPLTAGLKVFTKNIDGSVFDGCEIVDDPAAADVAVLRIAAAYEPRTNGFELFMHAGSLDYPDAERDEILALCAAVPTVIVVNLDRPAILTPFVDAAAAIIAEYGATDQSVADVLLGKAQPQGELPIDLPRSMASVEANKSDTPFDMPDALFRYGHGLRYQG